MFAGHMAVALASKRAAPKAPLGALVAASYGIDILWPLFLLTGVEAVRVDPGNTSFTPLDFVSYPWSHSLLMVLVWGVVAGGVYRLVTGRGRGALVVGALVVSHWVLDFLTHAPDLPLWPGGMKVGLGLWNSVVGTFLVEGALLAFGIVVYLRATEARDGVGRWALASLLVLVTAIWASGPFSPPPPGVRPIIYVGFALYLLPLWAWWAEAHRELRSEPDSA